MLFRRKSTPSLHFKTTDPGDSPFKNYNGELLQLDPQPKVTSTDEFMFLVSSAGYYDDLNEAIFMQLSHLGIATSLQLTTALQRLPGFQNITQRDIQNRLSKLKRKSFVNGFHFVNSNDLTHRASYQAFSLGRYGRKILVDMDRLEPNTITYVKCPSYKVKGILAATQICQTFSIFTNQLSYPMIISERKNVYLRCSAQVSAGNKTFLIESVRSSQENLKLLPDRIKRYKKILNDPHNFSLNERPGLIVIGESPEFTNYICKIFTELSKVSKDVFFTYDTAQNIDEILNIYGMTFKNYIAIHTTEASILF